MTMNPLSRRPAAITALTFLSLALAAGCGDGSRMYTLDPGEIEISDASAHQARLDDAAVELLRYSTECERASADALVSTIHEGTEFASEDLGALAPPCDIGPTPAIGIAIEDSSLIFDFSDVAEPGRFPTADFDGFLLDLILERTNALLVAATVDTALSTLPVEQDDIAHETDLIEVNFEGLAYDAGSFVKIDLVFAQVANK